MPASLELNGKRLPLSESCSIGRLPGNTVVLDDPAVSRRHALIHAHGRAGYWLMDFGSSNGVLLNGRRVSQPVRLQDRDQIKIAAYVLLFRGAVDGIGRKEIAAAVAAWKTTQRTSQTFTPTDHGVVLLDTECRISTITDRARQWLGSYFGCTDTKELPKQLCAWINQQAVPERSAKAGALAPAILFVPNGSKRLVMQLAERNSEKRVLLLSEEQTVFSTELLQTLGLTPKESQVLHWVAEGKTNPEIGVILNTSPRTVGKHVEHIFAKLGVESRTAALLYVVEKLSKGITH